MRGNRPSLSTFICCFTLFFILWKISTNLYVHQLARDKTEK